ncbi:TRAP transporter permease [Chloroflexota bacterium]
MTIVQTSIKARADKILDVAIAVLALSMVAYHMLSSRFLFTGPMVHLSLHLMLALLLLYLNSLRSSKRFWPLTLLFVLLSVAATGYITIFAELLLFRSQIPGLTADVMIIGPLLIILLLEGIRRAFGIALTAVISLFVIYLFVGNYVPGPLHIPYFPPEQIISRIGIGSLSAVGIYGTILSLSANTIFLFVVFGGLLQVTGATTFFIQFGRVVGRRLAGGSAMTAVVTSALVGMVSGSIAANIATTGSFTIPLMRKVGYRAEQAAAIEATASTGGQIMPPVMGVAAFLMAYLTGIPYVRIMAICAIPAILFFLSAGLYVQFQAMKMKIRPVVEPVDTKELLLTVPLFVIPLAFIILLLLMQYSLAITMSLAILITVVLSLFRKKTRPSWKRWVEGFTQGAIVGGQVGVVCASIGILLAAIGMSGLGVKLPSLVGTISGGNLVIALLLTMITSIILGLGMPSSGAYLMVAIAAAPALIMMGVTVIQAHVFSFYFSVLSFLTPPVAIGALIAARLAGANYMKTGIESVKVALGGFIVPFLCVWIPVLLLQPDDPFWSITGMVISFLIIIALQVVVCNYYLKPLMVWERILFTAIALTMFLSLPSREYMLAVPAIIVFVLASVWQWRKRKASRLRAEA